MGPSPEELSALSPEEKEQMRCLLIRKDLIALKDEMFAADPNFKAKSLIELNNEAVRFLKAGDDLRCVGAFAKFFCKLRENNLTHKELYVVHSNRAAAYLNLGLYEEALWDARRCAALAEQQFARTHERSALPSFVKSFQRKGFALLGLGLARQAKAAFEDGLKYDPFSEELKRGLEEATQSLLGDLLSGKGKEQLSLPAPGRPQDRISILPHSAPLHVVHPADALPVRLLSPHQAESDHDIKDTYNFMTVSADVRMPERHAAYLADSRRVAAFEAAVARACAEQERRGCDARVLHLGSGAGLLSLLALRHGALHVTAVDRWLYLAMATKESLKANNAPADRTAVVYKRPTDLLLGPDVPVSCNVLLLDGLIDDGLLSSGLLPAIRHAREKLLVLPDAVIVPGGATVFVQAVELRSAEVAGFDCSAANAYRWHPSHTSGAALGGGGGAGGGGGSVAAVALSDPVVAFHFDLKDPPETSDTKVVEVPFTADGTWNAVAFWFELQLADGVVLSSRGRLAPRGDAAAAAATCDSLQPAVQYLPGELPVEAGRAAPLRCSHNTVRLLFSVDEAEYTHLYKNDAAFPQALFSVLADEGRARAYQAAIQRQVARCRARSGAAPPAAAPLTQPVTAASQAWHGAYRFCIHIVLSVCVSAGEVHVLDIGAGNGLLSMMAARAGADSVVAAEIHEGVAAVARRTVAANGLSKVVSVVERDAALLQRGRDVRPKGCNMVVFDLFDAGLLGDGVEFMLEQARRNVLQPGAVAVPAAATLYCMGVEVLTGRVRGFDMSAVNRFRWDKSYSAVRLSEIPHRRLTKPKRVTEVFFDGSDADAPPLKAALKLEVTESGLLNAVVFWFDLHMDEQDTITNAPAGVGKGGQLLGKRGGGGEPRKKRSGKKAAGRPVSAGGGEASGSSVAAPPAPGSAAATAAHTEAAPGESAEGSREQAGEASAAGAEPSAAAPAAPVVPAQGDDDDAQSLALAVAPAEDPRAAEAAALRETERHYWGQALQYLERAVVVQEGKKVTVLAKTEGGKVHYSLREGVGEWVEKAPWKIQWGGGASVESPHFQRVHYCELLVKEFLMRVKCKRFPPIEKDMKMILAHCGSLFLDPRSLAEVYHEMVVLEHLHTRSEFSIGTTVEAISKPALELH